MCHLLIQIAENAEYIPDEWLEALDSTIENYISDLLDTKDHTPVLWENIWHLNDVAGQKPEQFIRTMLHLYFITYGKDISDIDFSGIDLSNICLSNYRLTARSKGHFHKARISKDTFFGKGHYLSVSAVSWSCEGSYYISASHDRSIHVHSQQSGMDFLLPSCHQHYIRCAACSPKEERLIASAGDDRELILWRCGSDFFAQDQWAYKVLGTSDAWIRSLSWSPDGSRIACGDADGNIKIFSLNGEVVDFEKCHETHIRYIKWSGSGNQLISGDDHGMVCIWNDKGELWKKILPSDDSYFCTGANWINDKHLIVSYQNEVMLYQITKTGELNCDMQKEFGGITLTSVFGKDGFVYLTVFHETEVEVLRIYLKEDGDVLADLLASYCFLDDMNSVICSHERSVGGMLLMICGARDGSIGKISIDMEEEAGDRLTFEPVGIKCNQSARCSAWSPDGKLLAVGYDDCRIRIWDVFHERCLSVLEGHNDSVKCIAWLSDEKIVSGSDDNDILIWKKCGEKGNAREKENTGEKGGAGEKENTEERGHIGEKGYIGERIYSHSGPVNSIVCLQNQTVIAGGDDGRISMITFDENGNPVAKLLEKVHQKRIYSLACNPVDENLIVSGGNDDFICLWNLKTGNFCKYSREHMDSIRSMCWQKGGQSLVTSSNDYSVMVRGFSLESFEFSQDMERLTPTLHDFIYGACVSGNGRYIVGGCTDSSVIFWDTSSRECILHHTNAHENFVWHVSESPRIEGNYYVATSSSDRTVKIWDVTKELSSEGVFVFPVIPNSDLVGCDFSGSVISAQSLIKSLYANGGIVDETVAMESKALQNEIQ